MSELHDAYKKLVTACGSKAKVDEVMENLTNEVKAGAHDGRIGMMIYEMRQDKKGKK